MAAETVQGEAEPTAAPVSNETVPPRDDEVLQEVLSLLSNPVADNSDASVLLRNNTDLRNALSRMASLLRDKRAASISQEKRIQALNVQVASLKDVIALTKDLLNIRNMEVEHLRGDITSVQSKMDEQRTKHQEMIQKLDSAMTLNEQLKTEYQTQLKLFQDLKEKYEQRANLLQGMVDQHNAQHET